MLNVPDKVGFGGVSFECVCMYKYMSKKKLVTRLTQRVQQDCENFLEVSFRGGIHEWPRKSYF